ncbi:response regulator [Microbulbifer sp. 2201CG32-9]|uniref:response regulator n=1 Tax=Microbulbifer sp. 2201CG32-9 TaxID=3232309 RepID=UPI00345BE119
MTIASHFPGSFIPGLRLWTKLVPPLAGAVSAPAMAHSLPLSLNANTWVPISWLFLATIGIVLAASYAAMLRVQRSCADTEHSEEITRLSQERDDIYRRLCALNSKSSSRDKTLGQAQETIELLRQENSDLRGIALHHLSKPVDSLLNTLETALHEQGWASGAQLQDAVRQLQGLKASLKQVRNLAQLDTFHLNRAEDTATTATTGKHSLSILLLADQGSEPIARALERRGHQVQRESSGTGDFATDAQKAFDLVLIDTELSLASSADAVKTIQRGHGGDLPIFALVSAPRPGDREEFLERGFTGILPRPVRESSLAKLLDWAANRTRPEETAGGQRLRFLNTDRLLQKRDRLGHQAFANYLNAASAALPKRMTELTRLLTARHWPDAEELTKSLSSSAEEAGLEAIAAALRDLGARLAASEEREACRQQRTEMLNLMRTSMRELNRWREENVHTEWSLQ